MYVQCPESIPPFNINERILAEGKGTFVSFKVLPLGVHTSIPVTHQNFQFANFWDYHQLFC